MSQRISGYAREANDRYETPEWVTLALIPHIPPIKTVWEPACGSGKMIRALQTAGFEVIGSDIAGGVDFLKQTMRQSDAIITNPPYTLAAEFIVKARAPAPLVCMLLRTDYDHAIVGNSLRRWC